MNNTNQQSLLLRRSWVALITYCLSFGFTASFVHNEIARRSVHLGGYFVGSSSSTTSSSSSSSSSEAPLGLWAKIPDIYDDENNDENNNDDDEGSVDIARRDLIYNSIGVGLIGASGVSAYSLFKTNVYTPSGFQRLPRTQFIAALGNPDASEGTQTEEGKWGLWVEDPGPRGVWLRDYKKDIVQSSSEQYRAPAGWKFDPQNWWLEEHGLIMEAPQFPLVEGKYLVTGGRLVTTTLTIDKGGNWKLDEGTLYDVTHLPCRSARYQPAAGDDKDNDGSPLTANPKDFPVAPGAIMPSVQGCSKLDYAVLFVVGKAV